MISDLIESEKSTKKRFLSEMTLSSFVNRYLSIFLVGIIYRVLVIVLRHNIF